MKLVVAAERKLCSGIVTITFPDHVVPKTICMSLCVSDYKKINDTLPNNRSTLPSRKLINSNRTDRSFFGKHILGCLTIVQNVVVGVKTIAIYIYSVNEWTYQPASQRGFQLTAVDRKNYKGKQCGARTIMSRLFLVRRLYIRVIRDSWYEECAE